MNNENKPVSDSYVACIKKKNLISMRNIMDKRTKKIINGHLAKIAFWLRKYGYNNVSIISKKDMVEVIIEENIPLYKVNITVRENVIDIKATMPFRIKKSSFLLLLMRVNEINLYEYLSNKPQLFMIDKEKRELTAVIKYRLGDEKDSVWGGLQENIFIPYINQIKRMISDHYSELLHLSYEEISQSEYDIYKELLKYSINTLKSIINDN